MIYFEFVQSSLITGNKSENNLRYGLHFMFSDSCSYSKNVSFLPYGRANRKILLEASDMALSFKFSDVEEMLLNGTIPISPMRDEIKDYNPNHETGNGFIYQKSDRWCIFAALVRAIETFKFPYDWNNIVREGLRSVLI